MKGSIDFRYGLIYLRAEFKLSISAQMMAVYSVFASSPDKDRGEETPRVFFPNWSYRLQVHKTSDVGEVVSSTCQA